MWEPTLWAIGPVAHRVGSHKLISDQLVRGYSSSLFRSHRSLDAVARTDPLHVRDELRPGCEIELEGAQPVQHRVAVGVDHHEALAHQEWFLAEVAFELAEPILDLVALHLLP